eukprot:5539477-Karenia_brevis.AAC.1
MHAPHGVADSTLQWWRLRRAEMRRYTRPDDNVIVFADANIQFGQPCGISVGDRVEGRDHGM